MCKLIVGLDDSQLYLFSCAKLCQEPCIKDGTIKKNPKNERQAKPRLYFKKLDHIVFKEPDFNAKLKLTTRQKLKYLDLA